MARHYHVTGWTRRGAHELVVCAASEAEAVAAATLAGYGYKDTTVYPVTDYYRRQFAGWYVPLVAAELFATYGRPVRLPDARPLEPVTRRAA